MKIMNRFNNCRAWLGVACLVWVSGCGLATTPPVMVTIKSAEEGAVGSASGGETESAATKTDVPVAAGSVSDLVGTIVLDGNIPTLPPLIAQGADVKDKEACSVMEVPDETLVVDSATKGVKNVFIILDKLPKGITPIPPPSEQIFDQKGCRFLPHAMIVRTKVPVLVMSADPVGHNTHTNPGRNAPFNNGIKPDERKGVVLTYQQAEREPFKVTCDIHGWMSAYHLPLDHGFAALTNEKGEFTIKGLPPGKHTFKIWHESGKWLERAKEITLPAAKPIDLKYDAGKFGK